MPDLNTSPPPTQDHRASLDRIFGSRARHSWSDRPVPEALIRELYDFVKLGPTSVNSLPARFRFLVSQGAKERVANYVFDTNRTKVLTAPCVVIIAYDEAFYDLLPKLLPIKEGVKELFAANPELAHSTAFRNSSLQGAYLIVAARLLGLDCGPMSGFDNAGIDQEFFAGTTLKSNFLCALGYANDEPFPRLPRLTFEEAAEVL
jgi:3-hydroxypropanoate dehydrogenase